MFSRCKPALRSHTLTKTEDEMLAEVLLTAAHHGATMVIDAIDPVGTLDKRVYERIGKVFGKQEEYEEYFLGSMAEDIGLYYGIRSRYSSDTDKINSNDGCIGASKALIASHIPFGVTGKFYSLEGYRALAVPMLSPQENDDDRILEYVERGGCLYFSGARSRKLLEALTGAYVADYTAEKNVYIAPTSEAEELFGGFNAKYPLPFDARAPRLEKVRNGQTLAFLTLPYTRPDEIRFASIHSNPPGVATDYPAMIEGSYGKGRFIWSALPIESEDMEEYRSIFVGCIRRLLGDESFSFVTDAPEDVEITMFEDEGAFYVNATHLDERAVMPTLGSFEIGIKWQGDVKAVELLPTKEPIAFERRGEYVYFKTAPLHVFDMYRVVK